METLDAATFDAVDRYMALRDRIVTAIHTNTATCWHYSENTPPDCEIQADAVLDVLRDDVGT